MTSAKDVFLDALDLPADQRERFVRRACAGDAALATRVRSLLVAHAAADQRLGDQPLVTPASGLFEAASGAQRTAHEAAPQPDAEPGAGAQQGHGVDDQSSVAARPGGDLSLGDSVGPYRLLEELGTGGFGTVFLAEQSQPVRRRVALKVVKLGMDTRAVIARFEAERQALALMDHPHIARVFDAGSTAAGRPYFVMELVAGEPITRYCDSRELDLGARLALFADLCIAIAHAHSKGVIHRDVKPNNVLVGEVDGRPVVKVIDFGIAKATAGALGEYGLLTREGHVIGTPASMAPEQLDGGGDVDVRADVYALGLLLYELLVGAPAVSVEDLDLVELRRLVREVDPPRPSLVARGRQLPADLDWIVMRCLEKDRERRYPSALALAEDIDNFLSSRPVRAAPPSALYRMAKLARRHRALVASVAVVVLGLLVAVAGLGLGLQRAEEATARLQTALAGEAAEAQRARRAEAAERAAAETARLAEQRARDAAELARAAEVEARAQADVALAVNRFLNRDLLGAAAPAAPGEVGRGRDVRVLEVLDVASRRLDQTDTLAHTPRVAGALHHTLGATYAGLGERARAEAHLRRARALLAPVVPADDPLLLDAGLELVAVLSALGRVQDAADELAGLAPALSAAGAAAQGEAAVLAATLALDAGDATEAERLAGAALASLEAALPAEHPVLLDAVEVLAPLRARSGQGAQAEALFRRAREGHRRLHGDEDPQTLVATVNLANFLRGEARLGESRALYEAAAATLERVAGPEHPDRVPMLLGLGYLDLEQGRFDEARRHLETGLELAERRLGEGHPDTWMLSRTLGRLHEFSGDPERALSFYRRAHDGARAHRPAGHPEVLQHAKGLSAALFALGRFDEAEALLLEVLAGERAAHGDDHATVITSRANLAFLRAEQGRLDEAADGLRAALASALAVSGRDDDPQALWLRSNLAEVLLQQGRFAEAAETARAALLASRALGLEGVEEAVLCRRLGSALSGLERFDEAERWLLAAHDLLDPDYLGHVRLDEVREDLAALYQAWGKPQEAARWRVTQP